MMTRRRFLVLAGGAAGLAATGALGAWLLPGEGSAASEPAIRWDEENCSHCGMTISDRRFAAGWIEAGGHQQKFDDIGCMVVSYREHRPATGTRLFVRDYAADRWLGATTAAFTVSSEIRSPMAYGVAAFETAAALAAALGEKAEPARSWEDLVADLERRG